jgi:ribosomal protein S7
VIKKKNKLNNVYFFFNISNKFKKNKRYSLVLGSRLLLSVSNKKSRGIKYLDFFNYFKKRKPTKRYLKRFSFFRIFLRNRKYLVSRSNVTDIVQIPQTTRSVKRYQIIKLKKIFLRNSVFLNLRKQNFLKRLLNNLRLASLILNKFSIIGKILPIWLKSLNSEYSLFKLFLFSANRVFKKRKAKLKTKSKIKRKAKLKTKSKIKRKAKLKTITFQQLQLLTEFYDNDDFSFNLFRRSAKTLKMPERKDTINSILSFRKHYIKKSKYGLLRTNLYVSEVLGQKGPTTADYVHRYKFVLLKLKKRRRWKFIKFHMLYPTISNDYLYNNKIFITKKRRKPWVWKSRIKIDEKVTLRIAKFYYYKLHYFNRVHTAKKFFFRKKRAYINKFYSSLKPIKRVKSFKASFNLILKLKNSVKNIFLKHKPLKNNRKLFKSFKKRRLLYKNLYFKFFIRKQVSSKLYVLNRNTNMYMFPILNTFTLKSFNLMFFLRPKIIVTFFKEKFSRIIKFFRKQKFIDPIFFSRIIKFLFLSCKRLENIQQKNTNFKVLRSNIKNFTVNQTFSNNIISSFEFFLLYFIDVVKNKPVESFSSIPSNDYDYIIHEKDRKRKFLGLEKYSILSKQRQIRVDTLLRRRKDIWLQPEFVMLNFKNLLIKRGLGARAEKLISSLLVLTKFKHKLNFVNFFIENRPLFGTKPRRKGSLIQQIPMLLTSKRSISLSQRQFIRFATNRGERDLILRIYNEFINTNENRSSSSKALAEQYKSTFLNRVLL